VSGNDAGGSAVARRVDERSGIVEEVEFFDGGRLFGCRHRPLRSEPRRLGVVICSPILSDFGANYRREVTLARSLAAAGLCVQRFHPRGTGHSGGERLDLTLATMTDDALAAVDRLVAASGVEAVALVGTRFSALSAAAAARRLGPAPIVLWEPVLRPARYFREGLRAQSVHRLKLGRSGIDDPEAELETNGFVDLLGIPVGPALFHTGPDTDLATVLGGEARPLLLVQLERRESLRPEYQDAVDAWTAVGLDVTATTAPTEESWWFVPDRLATSDELLELTSTWILDRVERFSTHSAALSTAKCVENEGAPAERPVFVPASTGELLAVVTEPDGAVAPRGVAAVMLRGGGWRPSSGPRRTQTHTARALAGLGYHGVRFSYHGIAESGGDDEGVIRLDRPHLADTAAVCDWVGAQGLRPVLVGNCFGARTALAAAATDPSVAGLVLLVPPVHDFEVARRLDRRPLSRFARRLAPGHVAAVLRDPHRRRALGRTWRAVLDVAGRRARRGASPEEAAPDWVSHRFLAQLDTVLDRELPVLFVYGRDDPYGKDFDAARTGPLGQTLEDAGDRIRVEVVPGRVHGVTSHETQEAVLAAIIDWAGTDLLDSLNAGAAT
jgi:alpha/beta superfamily hydrolase